MTTLRSAALLALLLPGTALALEPVVEPSSGLVTSENGDTASVWISLDAAPFQDFPVSVYFSGFDNVICGLDGHEDPAAPYEVWIDCDGFTFDQDDWDVPRELVIHGLPDHISNEDSSDTQWSFEVNLSTGDTDYDGSPVTVSGVNLDADPGLYFNQHSTYDLSEIDGITPRDGTHDGFDWVYFPFSLNQTTTGTVEVRFQSTDPSEGRVYWGSFQFSGTDSSYARQNLTLVGVDDPLFDTDRDFDVIAYLDSEDDERFDGLTFLVPLTTIDDEGGGIVIDAADDLQTSEAAQDSVSFDVWLEAAPHHDVVLGTEKTDADEGVCDPTEVTFDGTNWDTPQTITVTALDDHVDDGDVLYDVLVDQAQLQSDLGSGPQVLANPDFVDGQGGWAADVDTGDTFPNDTFTNANDPTITATQDVTLIPGCEYEILLDIPPGSDTESLEHPLRIVHQDASTDDALATFAEVRWSDIDNSFRYTALWPDTTIGLETSTGPTWVVDAMTMHRIGCVSGWDTVDGGAVSILNVDDDTYGVTVTAANATLTTGESGTTDSFQIVLDSAPTGPVTFDLGTDDATEARVSPTSVTFDALDWDQPRAVDVLPIDDPDLDGDIDYTIEIGAATSGDPLYQGLDPENLPGQNLDDDAAGAVLTDAEQLTTTELGDSDAFSIALSAAPTAEVTLTASSQDATEGTVAPGTLTFTPDDWSTPQELVLTGVDDDLDDENITFDIAIDFASSDAAFDGLQQTVPVTNLDDDLAGITLDGAPVVTSEQPSGDTFTLVLDTEPTADVTIDLASTDPSEATVEPTAVTFTPGDWDAPQTLTATGVDDEETDGAIELAIDLASSSDDPLYDGLTDQAPVTNLDDEAAVQWAQGGCGACSGTGLPGASWGLLALGALVIRRRR